MANESNFNPKHLQNKYHKTLPIIIIPIRHLTIEIPANWIAARMPLAPTFVVWRPIPRHRKVIKLVHRPIATAPNSIIFLRHALCSQALGYLSSIMKLWYADVTFQAVWTFSGVARN